MNEDINPELFKQKGIEDPKDAQSRSWIQDIMSKIKIYVKACNTCKKVFLGHAGRNDCTVCVEKAVAKRKQVV